MIVIVPIIGAPPALVAVNARTLLVPLATKPIAGFEFVQVNVTPAGVPARVLRGTAAPAQYV